MDPHLAGQAAALTTSCLWTFNSIFFTEAGKRIGSASVNAYRIVIAVALLCATHLALLGHLLPGATNAQWLWVGASGIVGLGVGDFGLFAAFVMLGTRRSLLVMALSPVFASFAAFLLLGEVFSLVSAAGVAITLTGVIWVVLEREQESTRSSLSARSKIWAISLALVGALGQGVGLALAKKGIYYESGVVLNPLSATLMRMLFGALFVWVAMLAAGRTEELRRALNDKQGIRYTAAGAFIGPFLGVTFSMIAVTYTQAGIAQTLMSLMPVLIIPVVWVLHKQKTSLRGIVGAVIAVLGVSVLWLA
jgi:drug/metabolite transporter (DMT)-like permease